MSPATATDVEESKRAARNRDDDEERNERNVAPATKPQHCQAPHRGRAGAHADDAALNEGDVVAHAWRGVLAGPRGLFQGAAPGPEI